MTSGHVLEIAAGTGVVTRELIRMLPKSVAITATDLSQPMLDRAQSHPGSDYAQGSTHRNDSLGAHPQQTQAALESRSRSFGSVLLPLYWRIRTVLI
jgi:hypothetical protein